MKQILLISFVLVLFGCSIFESCDPSDTLALRQLAKVDLDHGVTVQGEGVWFRGGYFCSFNDPCIEKITAIKTYKMYAVSKVFLWLNNKLPRSVERFMDREGASDKDINLAKAGVDKWDTWHRGWYWTSFIPSKLFLKHFITDDPKPVEDLDYKAIDSSRSLDVDYKKVYN